MLMNENSELRSFVSCSKNFSKNIINKSIKNNIVLINNDGGCQVEEQAPGVHTLSFGVTLSHTNLYIYIFSLIVTYILFCILMYILSLILFIIIIYILFFIVTYIFSISSNHISTKIFGISFSFGVTVTCIKFSIYPFSLIVIYIFIYTLFYSLFLIVNYISSLIVAHIVFISSIFIFYLVVPHSFIRILIQISNSSPINISFSSSFISFICISFISFIISSIFTSFTGLFISYNTVITI